MAKQNITKRVFASICAIFFFGAVSLLGNGCASGGGNEGTGFKVAVTGKTVDSNGNALPNLVVTVLETGDKTTTDKSGNFTLNEYFDVEGTPITLLVEGESPITISDTVQVGTVADNLSIQVALTVDRTGQVTVTDRKEGQKPDSSNSGGNTSSPGGGTNSGGNSDGNNKPSPNNTPTATATPAAGNPPSTNPTVAPTVTPTPVDDFDDPIPANGTPTPVAGDEDDALDPVPVSPTPIPAPTPTPSGAGNGPGPGPTPIGGF